MPSYLSPGVFVEEVPAGSRPIEGVGTAVAGFVGFAEVGPFNEPTLVTNWSQFTERFGGFMDGGYLAHAVYGFFANGGGSAYVVRVGQNGSGAASGNGRAVGAAPAREGSIGPYRVAEIAPAGAGRPDITVEVQPAPKADDEEQPPDDLFTLVIRRGGKVEETFDRVSAKRGKNNVVTRVAQESKLITLEEVSSSGALAGVHRRLRRGRRRPDGVLRARGGRPDHDDRRPRSHERLPERCDRPGRRTGRPDQDDRALRAHG
jgi:hypothetical protein